MYIISTVHSEHLLLYHSYNVSLTTMYTSSEISNTVIITNESSPTTTGANSNIYLVKCCDTLARDML